MSTGIGVHYTPRGLARSMVRGALDASFRDAGNAGVCRVLDPACGDGAFLLEAFDVLCERCALVEKERNMLASRGREPPDWSKCLGESVLSDGVALEPTNGRPAGAVEYLPKDDAGGRRSLISKAATELAIATFRGLTPPARRGVLENLFGVDIDAGAVGALRGALAERVGVDDGFASEVDALLSSNFRVGDALTGTDFRRTGSLPFHDEEPVLGGNVPAPLAPTTPALPRRGGERDRRAETQRDGSAPGDVPAIDWPHTFPGVAAAGGFDVIVGNPPYVRERNAKALFDRIAATGLGRRWREARMDLWYYFVHRSFDLLRPGGVLSFVVNSYWTSSRGAGKLIGRLERETVFEEIVLLDDAHIFDGVAGRHMVFRLRKRREPSAHDEHGVAPVVIRTVSPNNRFGSAAGRLADLSRDASGWAGGVAEAGSFAHEEAAGPTSVAEAASFGKPRDRTSGTLPKSMSPSAPCRGRPEGGGNGAEIYAPNDHSTFTVPHRDLFQHGRIVLAPADALAGLFRDRPALDEFFDVRQGMAENPPVLTRRHARELGEPARAGEGVFVVRAQEIERLDLTPRECALLRPYFDTARVGRYQLPSEPEQWVLYLTARTAPAIDDLPSIGRHLSRFRPLLERRRETAQGKCGWWHLHWPRDESLFVEPRILSVQMGRVPQFVFAERPTFVGFSVNVLRPRPGSESFSLPVLTAILNSPLAAHWFARHSKRRGVKLEISGHVLRQFPLPARNAALEREIEPLVRKRQAMDIEPASGAAIDEAIDRLVRQLYGEPGA